MNQADLDTRTAVYNQLTENTGRHLLDSGGAYGRNHERNSARTLTEFHADPEVRVETNDYGDDIELEITASLYHAMCQHLSYDVDMTRKFIDWSEGGDPDEYGNQPRDRQMSGIDEWIESLIEASDDGSSETTFNSYNGESNLSQIIQGQCFNVDGVYYVCIQVHGGCDARGGYSDGVVYELNDESSIYALISGQVDIRVKNPDYDEHQEYIPGTTPEQFWDWYSYGGSVEPYCSGNPEFKVELNDADEPTVNGGLVEVHLSYS